MTIGVLADDFTGAAEVAGAAFAAGFSAEVQTDFDPSTNADVVVVDTDTRSCSTSSAAAAAVSAVAERMRLAEPDRVFKKVDSLLRGHVAAEVDAVRRIFGLDRARVVPANPAMGRTIRDGRYLVDGAPLAETSLAAGPDHARASSDVGHLLGVEPSAELMVPDAATLEDVQRIANEIEPNTLPAGAAAFFEAMLREWVHGPDASAYARPDDIGPPGMGAGPPSDDSSSPDATAPAWRDDIRPKHPSLFLCGSLAAWRAGRSDDAARRGIPVFALPDALLEDRDVGIEIDAFVGAIRRCEGSVLIAVGRSTPVETVGRGALTERLASVSAHLLGDFQGVFVEGGATAAALARRMGWTRLRVVRRLAPGVVTLVPHGAAGVSVTTKVGSYPWPESVWPP